MTDGKSFISQLKIIQENMIIFEKIAIGQGDDYTNNKHLMLIQKQYNKFILKEIQKEMKMKIQQCFLLLKKQRKPLQIFYKEL